MRLFDFPEKAIAWLKEDPKLPFMTLNAYFHAFVMDVLKEREEPVQAKRAFEKVKYLSEYNVPSPDEALKKAWKEEWLKDPKPNAERLKLFRKNEPAFIRRAESNRYTDFRLNALASVLSCLRESCR